MIHEHTQINHGSLTHNSRTENRGETEERGKHTRTHRVYVVRRQAPSYVHGCSKPYNISRILSMIIHSTEMIAPFILGDQA